MNNLLKLIIDYGNKCSNSGFFDGRDYTKKRVECDKESEEALEYIKKEIEKLSVLIVDYGIAIEGIVIGVNSKETSIKLFKEIMEMLNNG